MVWARCSDGAVRSAETSKTLLDSLHAEKAVLVAWVVYVAAVAQTGCAPEGGSCYELQAGL